MGTARISGRQLRLRAPAPAHALTLEWEGASPGTTQGEDSTGGVSNYLLGSDPHQWRTGVPHYRRVRVRELYPSTDVIYHSQGRRVEFDLVFRPGAQPEQARFKFKERSALSLDDAGDLIVKSGGITYRQLRPIAYQIRGGMQEPVKCVYSISSSGVVGFRVGPHDTRLDLIIDPVIEYVTYLGGSGIDRIQALGIDAAGSTVVAGITNSPDFPGAGQRDSNLVSIFVTKLDPSGSNILFTTLFGARRDPTGRTFLESVAALTEDRDGNTYFMGFSPGGFPATANAWQGRDIGNFAAKLDGTGNLVYSTMLGPLEWGLQPRRFIISNGVAYVAGNVSRPEFLGTPGALQRDVAGATDAFILALKPDGSGPIFVTAFGGSGNDSLIDMALAIDGSLVLTLSSTSVDLPQTADALPYASLGPNRAEAALVRLDPSGSRLLYSTWLGTQAISGLTLCPDGNFVIAGSGQLPPDLVGTAPHYEIGFPSTIRNGYVAKWSFAGNRIVWSAGASGFSFTQGITAAPDGTLFWSDVPPNWLSGGALSIGSFNMNKLSADGSRMLYTSRFLVSPAAPVFVPDGTLWIAGTGASSALSPTPGALQTELHGSEEGYIIRLDLRSFFDSNFFVAEPQININTTLVYRIGEPPPPPLVFPMRFSGEPVPVQATTNNAGLAASIVNGASPGVSISADPSNATTAGTFSTFVNISSPAIADSDLKLPVSLRVLPAVSFDLSQTSVELHTRSGTTPPTADVPISTAFNGESFNFTVTSDSSWLRGTAFTNPGGGATLRIFPSSVSPGTYDGNLTIRLTGFQQGERVVSVHYIVDPAAVIQISPASIKLQIVKNQPARAFAMDVTANAPDVRYGINLVFNPLLKATQSSDRTPSQILFTADASAAEIGIYTGSILIIGESSQRIEPPISVSVISGGPLDVTPSAINYFSIRNIGIPLPSVTVLSPTPVSVRLLFDQPWVHPQESSGTTPFKTTLIFDSTVPEGVYKGSLTVSSGNTSRTIPITYTLNDQPSLVFPKTPINFRYQIGDPPPPPQTFQITAGSLLPGYFGILRILPYGPFDINPLYGPTPATITVSANVAGLAVGTYKSSMIVGIPTPDGRVPGDPIPITLEVVPNPNAPSASISAIVNAASYLSGPVSGGEILTIFGKDFGPSTLLQSQPDPTLRFPSTLAGVTFFFDDIPAPLIYLSSTQAAVVAPFGIAGKKQTDVAIEIDGKRTLATAIPVAAVAPAVFTANSTGSGIAAALNVEENGNISTHGMENPAVRGGIVTLFATGMGLTTPVLTDGQAASPPLPRLTNTVTVIVGGQSAELLYAGPAPGLIAGLTQLNIRIPQNVTAGVQPLLVLTGDSVSQPGVTLAIR